MAKTSDKSISQLIKSIEKLTETLEKGNSSLLSPKVRKGIEMDVGEIESKILSHEYNRKTGREAYNKAAEEEKKALKARNYEAFQKARAQKNALKDFSPEAYSKYITDSIVKIVSALANSAFIVAETNIKKQTIRLQAASELQARAIQAYGKSLNNVIAVQVGNITGTVIDTAFNSLSAVMEGGRTFYMKNLADAITYRKKENELFKANVEMATGVVDSVGGAMAGFGGTVGVIGNALSLMANIGKRAAMVEAARTQLEIQMAEEIMKNQDAWLQQIESIVQKYSEMSKQVVKSFLEAGNSAYAYSRTLGISSSSMRKYHDALIEGVNVQLSTLAMDFNDYQKMQAGYNQSNGGRTGILATREAMLLGGLTKRLDISAEEASTITGSMNVFNTSIADGSEMIYEMSRIANRMGLSATKFAKDMEKNLKLAEKYQFRGGVRGMMEMALWAQKTRFNMDELSSLQEKMIGGNIEDVMQTSARLNVLGGNAALYSNPMALLFNGVSNPAALAKNINSMVSGYGTFNRETGETEFSFNEMLRLNAIAQGLGMSRENLMNQARQAQKADIIRRKYGTKFGKNIEGVTQHATWSREMNDWIIKVNAPDTKEGFKEVALSELRKDDARLKDIFPEDKQDRLLDYVKDIRQFLSPGEYISASEKHSLAATMMEVSKTGMYEKQIRFADERFRMTGRHSKEYGEMVNAIVEGTWESQKQMNEQIENGNMTKLISDYVEWSLKQNNQMLLGMNEFIQSGDSIDMWLEKIASYLDPTNKTKRANLVIQDKEGKEFLSENVKKINNAITSEEIYGARDEKWYNNLLDWYADIAIGGAGGIIGRIRGEQTFSDLWRSGRMRQGLESGTATISDGVYRRLSNVKDAIITPRGTVYTHPDDMIAAFKQDGAIMNGLKNGVSKIEVDGTLTLKTDNGQQVNLIELLRSDPESIRRLTEAIITEANKNNYGGRSKHAPGRYSIN